MDSFSRENSHLKDEINLVSAMQETILAFTGAFDLDTLLQKIIEIFVKFSNSDRGSIFMYEPSTQRLVMRAMCNSNPELRFNAYYSTDVKTREKIGLTALAFIDSKIVVINSNDEIKSHPSHSGKYVPDEHKDKGTDCNALLCIPLKVTVQESEQGPLGVLKLEKIIVDNQQNIFTDQNVKDIELLVEIVSKSIQNFKNQSSKIGNSIHKILSKVLKNSTTDNLSGKLQEITQTFREVSRNANNVSIWLKEDSKLVCKSAVGYSKELIGKSYKLPQHQKAIQNIKQGKEKIGLTPWIFISEKIINIKSHKELINHPQYKGTFNHILYPDNQDKSQDFSQSFIGVPLRVGDKMIGVIQADSSYAGNFFTSEEEQIFTHLSGITAILIERDREFKLTQRRDTQLISLYELGTECYELETAEEILWYLLVGLTHMDGIGYNRAILFKLIDNNFSFNINGLLGLGPRDKNEGKRIKEHFESHKPLLKDSKRFVKENHPTSELQLFIEKQSISINQSCEFYNFVSKVAKEKNSYAELINIDRCNDTIKELMQEKLETYNGRFMAFSVVDSEDNIWIGICDNVYSNLTQHDEFTVKAANIFVKQISLALSRLSLKKSNEEIEEEAWQEFTATTAHRLGTETSIMSGALSFIKKSLLNSSKRDERYESLREDIDDIDRSLGNLKRAVTDFNEFIKPPELNFKQLQLSDILNTAVNDARLLQAEVDEDKKVKIIAHYPDELPIILGDRDSLLYVFKELIYNAIKAMPMGGELEISESTISNEYLILKIEDSGSGINPEYLTKIFKRGFRDRSGGAGLGLNTVKRSIKLHNGKVWAENNKTRGASFFVKLPIKKSTIA